MNFDTPLFIFEMANNHMGSVDHGLAMLDAFAAVKAEFPFRFAFKFQFRDLATFIHPDYLERLDLKYVKRFKVAGLSREEFLMLKQAAERHGFITICTPFDEPSVDAIVEMGFDILKVASCSFTDWPLLEKIVATGKPIIASTAAATLEDMDRVVSFLNHRGKQFALLHCVGEYPTKAAHLQLNQIDLLKKRYPEVPVGFSTHEAPDNINAIQLAVAKGARIFERHVAVVTPEFPRNEYSATPEQTRAWLAAASAAFEMCGVEGRRATPDPKEVADLRQFKRGVFANRPIRAGERIDAANTFLAFPNSEGQMLANDLSKYLDIRAARDLDRNAPVVAELVTVDDKREKVLAIVRQVRKVLAEARIVVPGQASLEISHHYGIDRFHEVGCVIVTVVNREYCKKLIILLAGQKHPEQYHKIKEETFVVLYGDVQLTLDGDPNALKPGDIVTVQRGVKHMFASEHGGVIEEISSTHYKDDSYYTDEEILKNANRKTVLSYWLE